MKTLIAVLALLICVIQAAPLENGQDETLTKPLTQTFENIAQSEEFAAGNTKIAFSVGSGISGNHGPFNTEVTLTFNKVLTNVGNAYSPQTGVFRAPIKGIYHVSASVFGNTNTWLEVYFVKNGQRVFGMSESPKGSNMSISRAVNLLLEQGDELYLRLKEDCQIYDDGQMYNTFSGFLLFPM